MDTNRGTNIVRKIDLQLQICCLLILWMQNLSKEDSSNMSKIIQWCNWLNKLQILRWFTAFFAADRSLAKYLLSSVASSVALFFASKVDAWYDCNSSNCNAYRCKDLHNRDSSLFRYFQKIFELQFPEKYTRHEIVIMRSDSNSSTLI